MPAPGVAVAVAWLAGCWLGTGHALPPGPLLAGSAALVLAPGPAATGRAVAGAFTAALAHASGARDRDLRRLEETPRGLAGPWRADGELLRDPEGSGEGAVVEVGLDRVWIAGGWHNVDLVVRLTVYAPADPGWRQGDRFEAFLRLRRDRPAANPGGRSADALRAAGVDARASLKSFRQLRRRQRAAGVVAVAGAFRTRVRAAVATLFPRHRPLVTALLLGERAAVDDELAAGLGRAGLLHLLAISGLHLGLGLGATHLLARGVGLPRPRAAAVAGLTLVLVVLTVVPRAPIRRAGWMAGALLLAAASGRRAAGLDALALAAMVLAAGDPWVVRGLGFQLTVAATAGILLLCPGGRTSSPRPQGAAPPGAVPGALARAAGALLGASVAAQATVAPLLAAATHRVTPAGLVLNLVAVPLTAVALGLAGLAVGLSLAGLPATGPARAAALLLDGLDGLAGLGRTLPLVANVPAGRCAFLVAASAGLGAWGLAHRLRPGGRGARRLRCLALLLGLAGCGGALWPRAAPAVPRIVVLDVGQGDSVLVQVPGRPALLVDVPGGQGTTFDPGARIVAPALRALGVTRLGAVALSHLHADHAGGVRGLLGEIAAAELWVGGVRDADLAVRVLGAGPEDFPPRPPVRSLAAGHRLEAGPCSWSALHPGPDRLGPGGGPVENDASLVLALDCGPRGILLAGDVEAPAEAEMARRQGSTQTLRVLKVPHHGSRTSTSPALLDPFPARHALVSVGWRNRFGHPVAEVLERLRRRGVAVYRTDRDGALTVTLGDRVRVRGARWVHGRGRDD